MMTSLTNGADSRDTWCITPAGSGSDAVLHAPMTGSDFLRQAIGSSRAIVVTFLL